MKPILPLFFLALFVSCQISQEQKRDDTKDIKQPTTIDFKNLNKSDSKFAFIEANKDYAMTSDEKNCFGDVFLFDFIDSVSYKLTEDCFYETKLTWSPDGKKLLFSSTRERVYKTEEPDMTSYPDIYILDLTSSYLKRIDGFYKRSYDLMYLSGLYWSKEGIIVGDHSDIFLIDEDGHVIKDFLNVSDSIYIYDFKITRDEKFILFSYSIPSDKSLGKIGYLNIMNNKFYEIPGNYTIKGTGPTMDSFLFGNRDSLYLYTIKSDHYSLVDISGLGDTLSIISASYLNSNELLFNSIRNPFFKGKLNRKTKLQGYIGIYNLKDKSIYYPFNDSRCKSDLILYNKN